MTWDFVSVAMNIAPCTVLLTMNFYSFLLLLYHLILLCLVPFFLDAFAKLRKLPIGIVMSVLSQGTTLLAPHSFS